MASPSIAPGPYRPDIAIPPGATIRELLGELGMTQAELAQRMKRPANKLNEIIQGKRQISVETAMELELTLGLPADFWLNLEKNYQLTKGRLSELARLKAEAELLRQFPVREMCKLGWLERKPTAQEQVKALLSFFGVASFSQLSGVPSLAPAWRTSQQKQPSPYALCAWIRQGTLQASKVITSKFDRTALLNQIEQFRSLTTQEHIRDTLAAKCAQFGVALVFVPHLPQSYVNGAAYWLADKAVLQLSLNDRWADVMWFSFFHELAHLLLHASSKQAIFLDEHFSDRGAFITDNPVKELEANAFAANALIPSAVYQQLLQSTYARAAVIKSFANDLGVHPGVIVGRLQHDKKLPPSGMNQLRCKLA